MAPQADPRQRHERLGLGRRESDGASDVPVGPPQGPREAIEDDSPWYLMISRDHWLDSVYMILQVYYIFYILYYVHIIYIYVCIYVYIYMYIYICMYIYMYVYIYVCIYMYVYICMYICIYIYMHTYMLDKSWEWTVGHAGKWATKMSSLHLTHASQSPSQIPPYSSWFSPTISEAENHPLIQWMMEWKSREIHGFDHL